jgi:mannosyltransferase OCH1-like enzyme
VQLSQIYITDDSSELPELLVYSSSTTRECLSAFDHVLYGHDQLRSFIESSFPADVITAYDQLVPYSYKADLGKFCLAYAIGGWYVDVSIKFLKKISTVQDDVDIIYFNDLGDGLIPGRLSYSVQASLFYSKPKNPVFEVAINKVVENCKNKNYGVTPVCPTGPGVFGASLAQVGRKPSHLVGDFMPLTPMHPNKNRSYVLPNGEIVALHKNAWFPAAKPAEISSMGAKGTNNYVEIYHARNVYGEND